MDLKVYEYDTVKLPTDTALVWQKLYELSGRPVKIAAEQTLLSALVAWLDPADNGTLRFELVMEQKPRFL